MKFQITKIEHKDIFGLKYHIKGYGFDNVVFFTIHDLRKEHANSIMNQWRDEHYYIQYVDSAKHQYIKENFRYFKAARKRVYELLEEKYNYWYNQTTLLEVKA